MRIVKFAAACLLLAGAVQISASAQAPTPTPKSVIRIGRPAGGGSAPGTNPSGSTGGSSTNTNSGQKPPAGGGPPGTLVCRMGGGMRWSLVSQFDVEQTQINGKTVRVPVVVALFDQLLFARGAAPAAADGSNLQPGTCSFRDRAMTAADPDKVVADVDDFMLQQNVLWGNGSTLRSEATVFGGALSFQNKQAFSMQVALINGTAWKVSPGTKPKAIK